MVSKTNEELISRCQDNHDEAAFTELHRRHQGGITYLIRELLKRRAIRLLPHAADILQEVFATAYDHRDQFVSGTFGAWLYALARRVTLNYIKNESRLVRDHNRTALFSEMGKDYDPSDENSAANHRATTVKAAVERGITVLPETHRQVIELVLRGLTNDEIAIELNQPCTTVVWRRRESLQLMRLALETERATT